MSKWHWAVALALQAHFGASYVAPTQPHLGLFNYICPWVIGDHGLLVCIHDLNLTLISGTRRDPFT